MVQNHVFQKITCLPQAPPKLKPFLMDAEYQKTPTEKKSKKRLPALGPDSQKTITLTAIKTTGFETCAEVGGKPRCSRDPNSFAIT